MFSQKLIYECEVLAHSNHHSFADLCKADIIRLGKAILKDQSVSLLARGLMAESALLHASAPTRNRFKTILISTSWNDVISELTGRDDMPELFVIVARQHESFIDAELRALS